MPRVSAAFFAFGALCLLAGMTMGMQMGGSGDFTLMPAHAHLNLLGWVTMSLYGTFYALTRETLSGKLAWANFALAAVWPSRMAGSTPIGAAWIIASTRRSRSAGLIPTVVAMPLMLSSNGVTTCRTFRCGAPATLAVNRAT